MSSHLKTMISQKRKRFVENGFDLDLTYITDNVVAMGYPAESLEGIFRNHIDDVAQFLEIKHRDKYKIYNLCAEKCYDITKFNCRVARFPFYDHNPPCMELITQFCVDVYKWLTSETDNVAVVHCKAGKGRTGVMICCYLLHCGLFKCSREVTDYYGQMRTTDGKGVTIPSQKRYISYYASLLRDKIVYKNVALLLRHVKIRGIPSSTNDICFRISQFNLVAGVPEMKMVYKSGEQNASGNAVNFVMRLTEDAYLQGDVKFEFYSKSKPFAKKRYLFHFWFNTFFVRDVVLESEVGTASGQDNGSDSLTPKNSIPVNENLLTLVLHKDDIDGLHKDKNILVESEFKITLILEKRDKNNA